MTTKHDEHSQASSSMGPQATGSLSGNPSNKQSKKGPEKPLSTNDSPDTPPKFGATFVPGGHDDYQMPEMYAPSPQRVMPEVPHNMQQDLQRMELEARQGQPRSNNGNGSTPNYLGDLGSDRGESLSNALATYTDGAGPDFQPFKDSQNQSFQTMAAMEAPNFSPFPKVKGDNIPPSDEEKEEILYNAREHVLHSNNVNMQLSWARDALNWCETSAEVSARENKGANKTRSSTPKIEHELRVDAINIVKYLAEQRHPEAVFMKAKWDEFGKFGYRGDKKGAFMGYKIAAEQGWGRAEYRMGMMYENSNELGEATTHYNTGERMGDSAAQYRLGMMALLGQYGQRKDLQRGIELINKAADTADEDAPQGAYVFGMLIARDLPDIVVPEGMLSYDVDTARQYIEKAAYLGFAKAQLKMGQAYELCQLGCDFKPAYSLHYYGLAARQGQPEAALGVSRWFLFGYDGNFEKNESLAFKYAKQAADAQLATGEFAMGYYHEIGIHVQKDLQEARRWYEQAASHGNNDAVGRLESLNQHHALSKKDHETTALNRIKSQHGSMRGKRPERLERLRQQNQPRMPTLSENGGQTTPKSRSPRISPHPSPPVDFPDPSYGNSGRQPAFSVNLNHGNLAVRPKSAAPYPEDDSPAPLNLNNNRPRSAAPYPEDDFGRTPYNPQMRPPQGGAFGIRPQSSGRGAPGGNLSPGFPPAGMPPRGRVPPTNLQSGYRQPSPGASGYRQGGPGASQMSPPYETGPRNPVGAAAGTGRGGPPPGQYAQGPQSPPMAPPACAYPGAAQPGRDYAPRTSSRPISHGHDMYGAPAPAGPGVPASPRHDCLSAASGYPVQQQQRQSSQPQARPGIPLKDRPMDTMGRSSAPPTQNARPAPSALVGSGSPAPSTASSSAATGAPGRPTKASTKVPTDHPDGKTFGNGPATFDEMGIARVKDKDECVVM